MQVADGSSGAALAYLSAIREDPSDLTSPFLKGLIFETFVNEKLEFRFKEECLAMVLGLLASQKDIEAELVEAIDTSKPKSWISGNAYQRVLDLVKEKPELKLLAEVLERNNEKLTATPTYNDDF